MNSLSLIVLFHVLTGIHGKAMTKILPDECLVKQSKLLCTDGEKNNSCKKEDCRKVLSSAIKSVRNQHNLTAKGKDSQYCDDDTGSNANDVDKSRNGKENRGGNDKKDEEKNGKEKIFKLGAIVGISVGITGTIILFLIISITIFVCRRRSKKKKRKQQTRPQSVDQGLEMANLESGPTSTNKGGYNVLSTNKSLDTNEVQGEYFVLDPSITKYDKDLSNRKLPEIKRFSGADGDENVYYEIDEYKIESLTDMEAVKQKQIIEVRDKGSYHSDQSKYEIQLRSMKREREQLTRQQSIDQRTKIVILESIPSSTNKGGNAILSANESLNTDEAQGEYFVLDPSITKYDKDSSSRVLLEVKRFSDAQGYENVYNEIDEDKFHFLTDMKEDYHKQIEDVRDIVIYHSDQTNNETQLRFDNTSFHVTSEEDDNIF